jgi:signal transduction histidine kinase
LSELRQLEAAVLDAESGMRGYVLAGGESYLQPLARSPQAVNDSLNRLRRLTGDNPEQALRLGELAKRAEARMALVRSFVEAARNEGPEAGQTLVAGGEGKAAMDALRAQIRVMERGEERLLAAREADANVLYWTAVISSLISGALGLLLAAFGFVLAQREVTARAQESRELEAANERLEQRVRERTTAISDANQHLREEIAEREQAEKKVRLFAEELQRSNRELEQFAAVASHDLQEPLRKIQAFGDRLQNVARGKLDDKAQDYLDRMLASAGRMRTLIDGLLQYARVSTRHQPAAAVDLAQVARDVVSDLESRLQQSQGKVEINGLPTVTADPMQMRQLLQNLIGNALKFHRPGVPPNVRVTGRVAPAAPVASNDTQLVLKFFLVVE